MPSRNVIITSCRLLILQSSCSKRVQFMLTGSFRSSSPFPNIRNRNHTFRRDGGANARISRVALHRVRFKSGSSLSSSISIRNTIVVRLTHRSRFTACHSSGAIGWPTEADMMSSNRSKRQKSYSPQPRCIIGPKGFTSIV